MESIAVQNQHENNDNRGRNEERGRDEETSGPPTPKPVGGLDDEGRMKLTDEELEWAMEIKEAVEANRELEPMSDFMYAQFAILTLIDPDDTNLETVLERIENYQHYLRDHKLQDTSYEAACQALDRTWRHIIPGHYLSFNYNTQEEAYVMAIDSTNFDRTVVSDQGKQSTYLACTHATFHAQQIDFEAVRKGVITLFECSGYDWRNPDMYNVRCARLLSELANLYPLNGRSFRFYNTGLFANLLFSMIKKVFPKCISKQIELGWEYQGQRLDKVLLTPDVQTATERNLIAVKQALQKRYQNERNFKLKSPDPEIASLPETM